MLVIQNQIRILVVFIGVAVLKVVGHMVVTVPWFNQPPFHSLVVFKKFLRVNPAPWGIKFVPGTLKAKLDDLYLCRGSKYLCLCVRQLYRDYLCKSSDFCIYRVRPQEILKAAIFLN